MKSAYRKQAFLLFEPVPKAVGYQVQVAGKDARKVMINGSKLHHILLDDLDQNAQYQFTLQAFRYSESDEKLRSEVGADKDRAKR